MIWRFLRLQRLASDYLSLNLRIQRQVAQSSTAFTYFGQYRCYAKGSNRGGPKIIRGNIADSAMTDLVDVEKVQAEMKQVIGLLRDDYLQQLDVRTNLQAFERLIVKLPDNSEVPLNHLAQVTFKNSQMAIVDLTASPHAVRSVANALMKSGLCANPQMQTTTIYIPLQKPSREYREKLVQTAKLLYNRCHDQLREVDRKHQLQLRQVEGTAPKDTYKSAQMLLHDLVKQYAHQAEEMMKTKQKELLEEIK